MQQKLILPVNRTRVTASAFRRAFSANVSPVSSTSKLHPASRWERTVMPMSPRICRSSRSFFSLLLARINSNLVRPLSIKEIAQEAGLSASHLRRRFREEMGISLGEYLAEQRLAGAKILLENTTQPIGEVARQCGYESIYAFCRFFRKRSGISPGKYRKFRENNRILAEVF